MSLDDDNPRPRSVSPWMRWLSLRGYGLVTSTLFGAETPPVVMRARFERLSRNPREAMRR